MSEADSGSSEGQQPDSGSTGTPRRHPDPGWLHCPQCGDTRIRKRGTPFVINVTACIALPPLVPLIATLGSAILGFVWFGVTAVAFLVLPVTTCIALVGRYRCRSCGYRFVSARSGDETLAAPRFPWEWSVLSVVLLVLLCVVVPLAMRARTAGTGFDADLTEITATVKCSFFLWFVLIWQAIAFCTLRRRLKSRLAWALLLVLPALILGARSVYMALPAVRARILLANIGTATLPPTAREVRISKLWGPDQADIYICFTADPNDIGRFLDDSPVLQGAMSERFPAQEARASDPNVISSYKNNAFCLFQDYGPEWFRRRSAMPTVRYMVCPEDPGVTIEVTVDEQCSLVYVHLRHVAVPPSHKKSGPPRDTTTRV